MAYRYPDSLQELIHALSALPGIGPKAAQRLAFHLLTRPEEDAAVLSHALVNARRSVHPCPLCGNFTDDRICSICADEQRDKSLLCVVEGVADLISMERSGSYRGRYHVLGGAISPMDGVGPDKLNIASLLERVEKGSVREIIMATNPTPEGESTALYLAKKLADKDIRISRLAHGMPVGGSLAFTDEATLDLALSGRRELS